MAELSGIAGFRETDPDGTRHECDFTIGMCRISIIHISKNDAVSLSLPAGIKVKELKKWWNSLDRPLRRSVQTSLHIVEFAAHGRVTPVSRERQRLRRRRRRRSAGDG